ncbi:MAG TPA: hypothetical protein VN936_00395 [Candidatus Acidoferrum sp.]|nr:hypothetical protein [Candidatus Acidoferrum sp.]
MRVVNESSSALVCRIWIVTKNAGTMLAHPVSFEIAAFSTIAMQVPVRARDFNSFQRALAEIAGDNVHCIVESAPLPRIPRRGFGFAAAVCSIAGLLALTAAFVGATALRASMPHIAAFAVPPMALSGSTVQAEYEASGAGRLAYRVTAPDGHLLQGGMLTDRAGAIPIAIPASSDPGAYTLQMTMQGPLGDVKEVRVLNALASRPNAGAHIASVQVSPVVAKPGQPIDVAYAASGDSGYIRLTSADGTIWAQKPFSSVGATSFVVPSVAHTDEMRVVLHVTKGHSTAESSAGFVVAGTPATRPVAAGNADDASTNGGANGTFAVMTPSVPSGGTVRLNVLSPRDHMHLALVDGSTEVSSVDVGSDAGIVTLKAPAVKVPTKYTVVANFTDGFGQESVVEPITVRP